LIGNGSAEYYYEILNRRFPVMHIQLTHSQLWLLSLSILRKVK
jgi:hypothetical protein